MKRCWMAGLAAALTLTALTTWVPAAHAQGRGETVKFQDYPGHGNLLIRVAKSKGWCDRAGIKCELQMIATGPLGVQALIGGSIDVAQAPIDVVAASVLRGSKVKTIAGSAVSNIFHVVVGNGLALPGEAKGYPAYMADLKGRKVGVTSRGAATETMFAHLLQGAGLKADDVTYVAVGAPNTAYAALVNKQVDAIVSWEPSGVMCELSKQCRVLWRGTVAPEPADLRAMYGAGTGLVMRSDYLEKNPHVAEAVVRVSKEAEAFVNDRANLAEVVKISAETFKFDMPQGDYIARRVIELSVDSATYRTMVRRDAVKATLDYLAATKQIAALPSVADLVWDKAPAQ